jgi:hypothetical protein
VAVVDVALIGPTELVWLAPGCAVSSLVMANPLGTLLDPLAFRFLEDGPMEPEGDACRERFLGVIVAEVLCEIVVGFVVGTEGVNDMGKFLCRFWRSELE